MSWREKADKDLSKESSSNEILRQERQHRELEVLEGQAYEVYGFDEK